MRGRMAVQRRGLRSRRFRALALTGASAALVAAGCGSSSNSSGGGSASGSCSNVSIGLFAPMTGTNGEYGQTGLKATKLAISDFQKTHSKCHIGIVQYDAQGDPAPAPGLARKAISAPHVVAINGPGFSGVVEAAEPIFDAAGMPAVTANATEAALAHKGWKVFHRTVVNDGQEGPAAAQYLVNKKHLKSFAVIDNQQAYGKGLADDFAAEAKKLGATVVDREAIDPNSSDYSATVNKIKASNADAVFCGCLDPEAARLVKQMRAGGVNTLFSGGSGLHTPNYLKEAGTAAEGSITGTGGADPSTSSQGRAWLARWKKSFGGEPAIYGVEYYNSAMAILNAIGAGKTSRSAINSYLGSEHFQGPTGPVSFLPDGNIKAATVNIYTVQKGAFKHSGAISANPD